MSVGAFEFMPPKLGSSLFPSARRFPSLRLEFCSLFSVLSSTGPVYFSILYRLF